MTTIMQPAGNQVKEDAFWNKASTATIKTYRFIKAFLKFIWVRIIFHWLIISAGTVSECVFLMASLWMSLNSSVHFLVLAFISEKQTVMISGWATASYVALPELILGLAIKTTIDRIKTAVYTKSIWDVLWAVLFGLPTIVFFGVSFITVGCSVAKINFIMPEYLVIIRALAGYMFSLTSLVYSSIGEPQEADRLRKKDQLVAELRQENADNIAAMQEENEINLAELRKERDTIIGDLVEDNQGLKSEIEKLNAEIENQKVLIEKTNQHNKKLETEINKSDDDALQAYPEELINVLKSGVKTVNISEITRYTGFQKRRIEGAIGRKELRVAPKNKELIMVDSLVNWLKTVAPSEVKTDELPALHIVNQ